MIPITKEFITPLLPKRTSESHKFRNGYLIAVVGSKSYPGAARLSTHAAAKVGAGGVQVLLPQSLWPIIGSFTPEIIPTLLTEAHDSDINPLAAFESYLKIMDRSTALLIGCGMGRTQGGHNLIQSILSHSSLPTVIDGDALYSLGKLGKKFIEKYAQGKWILTPHQGELNLLQDDLDLKNHPLQEISKNLGITLLVKGFPSHIYTPNGNIYITTNGNPAASTAGCGDALAGVIAGYMAQGLEPADAACVGLYKAGETADRLVKETGSHTLLASEAIAALR